MTGSQRYSRRNDQDDLAGHSSFLFGKPRAVGTFFQKTCSQCIINSTEFLQVDCFKFVFFPCDLK